MPSSPEWTFEPFDRKPYDLFFLKNGAIRLVGRQQHLASFGSSEDPPHRTPLVTAPMILGEAMREQVLPRGVAVFYRPFPQDVRDDLFRTLARDPQTDLHYPFTAWNGPQRKEWCSPADFWTAAPERVRALNDDERPLREHTLELLEDLPLACKVAFDPACSTGEFLHAIKSRHPDVRTVGQDLSADMVEHCRGRVDEVHCGDSLEPSLPEESADLVIFRFLNFRVVTIEQAYHLFRINALRCRIGGHILVMGYTPVLVSPEWFEILGLHILQRTAYWPERDAIFQYFFLRREGPLSDVSFTIS